MDILEWIDSDLPRATQAIADDARTVLPQYGQYREQMNDHRGGIYSDLAHLSTGPSAPSLPERPRITGLTVEDGRAVACVLITVPGLPVVPAFGLTQQFDVDLEALDQLRQ